MSIQKWTRLGHSVVLPVAVILALSGATQAATIEVKALDSKVFSPSSVRTRAGNSVHWAGEADTHSVHQVANLFDSGNPEANLSFTRKFSAGTFRYICEKHGDQGMKGVVRVAPVISGALVGSRSPSSGPRPPPTPGPSSKSSTASGGGGGGSGSPARPQRAACSASAPSPCA